MKPISSWTFPLSLAATGWLALAPVTAQCTTDWAPATGSPGANARVRASITWDPDGTGPLPPHLVIAGEFTVVGDAVASGLAMQHPVTGQWSPLASDLRSVAALDVLPDGRLLAAGGFRVGGGAPADFVAAYDGTSWSQLGSGLNGTVSTVTQWNGRLVAGGSFTQPHHGMVELVGSNWVPFGQAFPLSPNTTDLLVTPAGELFASSLRGVHRYDGSQWVSLGLGSVQDLTFHDGKVVAGGTFSSPSRIAAWNGSTWEALDWPSIHSIDALGVTAAGNLVAATSDTNLGFLAERTGSTWAALGGGLDDRCMLIDSLPNGDLLLGGNFLSAGGIPACHVARWNGAFSPLATGGTAGIIAAMAASPDGLVYATGDFVQIDGTPVAKVAVFDGTAWQGLGTGLDGAGHDVTVLRDGRVMVVGDFRTAGGTPASHVAIWDGTSWSAVGAGSPCRPLACAELPNGNLLAGSDGGCEPLQIWDGQTWSRVPGFPGSEVDMIEVTPAGDIFTAFTGWNLVTHWNGSTWRTHPAASAITQDANGDVLALRDQNVSRFDGTAWQHVTDLRYGDVIVGLPDGGFFVGGSQRLRSGITALHGAGRWDGTAWHVAGSALLGAHWSVQEMLTATALPNGEVFVAGRMRPYSTNPTAYYAQLRMGCPGGSQQIPGGCPSSGGNNELAALQNPFLGGSSLSEGSGMPAMSFAAVATGFALNTQPLSTYLPQAGAGCDILLTPYISLLATSNQGTLRSELPIPNDPVFVQVTYYQQMIPFELDGNGQVIDVTSTNLVSFTIGGY
ncbi:MAG: hypothetical protein NXI31_16540 [bacterium]|nr:hypothetical protein [bacterium]